MANVVPKHVLKQVTKILVQGGETHNQQNAYTKSY